MFLRAGRNTFMKKWSGLINDVVLRKKGKNMIIQIGAMNVWDHSWIEGKIMLRLEASVLKVLRQLNE